MTTFTSDGGTDSAPTRLAAARETYAKLVEPTATGLPRWPVLLWFPALLTGLLALLVALGISGSSTGMFWAVFGSGTDPELIAGSPRPVRSDEWLTFGSWVISQASQGFPARNEVFPGGMDTTVLLDLPAWDWSTLFRPQAIGFMLFGLDHGLAVRWWLPGFAMMAAAYAMLVTLMPRRPVTAVLVAVAFFFSPFLNWWFAPSVFFPAVLCFTTIAAVLVAMRDERRWVRVLWAAITGYAAVCTIFTLYPPFILPAVLIAVAICLGAVLLETGKGGIGFVPALKRLYPILVAGLSTVTVVVLFFLTRSDTIAAITGTVYPGQRVEPTGLVDFNGLVAIFGAPFADGLQTDGYTGLLGPNSSEAATPVLLGLFLLIPLLWFVVRDWVVDRRLQWMLIGCLAITTVFLAFLLIPGWDSLAHLLLLDRMTVQRTRLGLGIICVVAIGLLTRRLDERDTSVPWVVSLLATGLAAVSIVVVWMALDKVDDPSLANSTYPLVVSILFVLSVFLFTRRQAVLGAAAFLIVSVVLSVGINPLYRGVFNLANETDIGREVERIDDQQPGTWLGMGSFQLSSVLVETGVSAFNGVQLYPVAQMWQDVDPTGQYEEQWNRYASLAWEPGTGEPVLRNPQADIVVGTFDSCSTFAQQHVQYVLTDNQVDQQCLTQIDQASDGASTYFYYEVVPTS